MLHKTLAFLSMCIYVAYILHKFVIGGENTIINLQWLFCVMTKPFAVVALFTLPHKTHINKLMCTNEYQRLLKKCVDCKILVVQT